MGGTAICCFFVYDGGNGIDYPYHITFPLVIGCLYSLWDEECRHLSLLLEDTMLVHGSVMSGMYRDVGCLKEKGLVGRFTLFDTTAAKATTVASSYQKGTDTCQ